MTEVSRALELASGFTPSATPAERELAARPQPDGYYREMTGLWHGVPGLEALQTRWEGFAGETKGFAVLAALLSESEGKPEEALEKLRGLTGSDARWNEGRLLALLGREQEAVAVLSALTTAADRPEMGAAALIALTELDCIRGDFAAALGRSSAAWEARQENGFRLRILERHLSLLVEAGREKVFLEDQFKLAESTGDHLKSRPEGPDDYNLMATTLQMHLDEGSPSPLPPELVRRVTLALESAAADNPSEGEKPDLSLWKVAHAAAGDPRWHGLLRQFLARQPAPLETRSPDPAILGLKRLFEVLDSGRLLPDLALHFTSPEPGEGVLHWKTRGLFPLQRPSRDSARSGNASETTLPWAKLAADSAAKCDAIVIVEDPVSGAARVVARLEPLRADGEIQLENLPEIGRLRVQLYQREAPLATAELPPLDYNSFPALIDTAKAPDSQTGSPGGWQLLADPIPLGAATQWYIDSSGPEARPWPKGIHLILMDEAGLVCASTPFSEEGRSVTLETAGFHGLQLGLNRLAPTSPFPAAEARLRQAGPPRQLALAISLQQRSGMEPEKRAPATLTLREWPTPPAPSSHGRLEILRFWQLVPEGEYRTHPPAIADNTSLAAWFTPGKILLLDLLKEDPPHEIALNLPSRARLDTLFWESGRLVIGYVLPDAVNTSRRYGFVCVRPGDPVPVSPLGDLPPDIRLYPSYDRGFGLGPIFLNAQGHICGVLDPGGKLLPLPPPSESGGPSSEPLGSYQQLSATTYLGRPRSDGRYPLLDWTDGTLRLSSVAKPPDSLIKPRRPWRTDASGTTGDPAANPPKRWRHPLALNDFRPISENLVAALGAEGSLVLFRLVPDPSPATQPSPDN